MSRLSHCNRSESLKEERTSYFPSLKRKRANDEHDVASRPLAEIDVLFSFHQEGITGSKKLHKPIWNQDSNGIVAAEMFVGRSHYQ